VTDDQIELELWQRARHNDGDAFAQLFDLHRQRVFRRAWGLTETTTDAEDLSAAAFFELWRKRRSITPVGGSVLPWLLVTVLNLSRNLQRSTSRYRRLLGDLPRDVSVEGPDAQQLETRRRLADALAGLSPGDSALLLLTAVEGFAITDAAATIGITPVAARVRLHRARARLRVELHDLAPILLTAPEGLRP
jgi:RNA polymerase sigma-70 factor, ECF subfamily